MQKKSPLPYCNQYDKPEDAENEIERMLERMDFLKREDFVILPYLLLFPDDDTKGNFFKSYCKVEYNGPEEGDNIYPIIFKSEKTSEQFIEHLKEEPSRFKMSFDRKYVYNDQNASEWD